VAQPSAVREFCGPPSRIVRQNPANPATDARIKFD
jgi:hypothetical protein